MTLGLAVIVRTVLVLVFMLGECDAGSVTITDSLTDTMFTLAVGPSQRCYSIDCYFGEVTDVKWKKLEDPAWIAFYPQQQCQGKFYAVRTNHNVPQSKFPFRLGSFMVWESGMYQTRGYTKRTFCPVLEIYESVPRNSTAANTTGSSSISGDSDSGVGLEDLAIATVGQ